MKCPNCGKEKHSPLGQTHYEANGDRYEYKLCHGCGSTLEIIYDSFTGTCDSINIID
ncbi:hypothetical protein GCM10023310_69740 [Paenibacillus vulneris]